MSLFHKHQEPQKPQWHQEAPESNAEEVPQKPKIEFNIIMDGKSYVSGMGVRPQNDYFDNRIRTHTEKLMTFYKTQSVIYKYDTDVALKLIKQVSPHASQNTCPYCGVIHSFTASRARKCPECGEKMVVRNGLFLKEVEAEGLQQLSNEYYSKAQDVERLKNTIQSVQDDKQRRNYGQSFLEIAEAYELCAVIHNEPDKGGFTYWDYAWRVLNNDVLLAIAGLSNSQKEILSNGFADVRYARGMHLLRKMKASVKEKEQNKYALIATSQFYEFLIDLRRYDLNHWGQDSAIKNIQITSSIGHVTEDQINEMLDRLKTRPKLSQPEEIVLQVDREVKDYVLVETDPERLKWMIY